MKTINWLLNVIMGSAIGVFCGMSIFKFFDYRNHPELYALNSAPWYTGILLNAAAMLVILLLCGLGKYILRKRAGKKGL